MKRKTLDINYKTAKEYESANATLNYFVESLVKGNRTRVNKRMYRLLFRVLERIKIDLDTAVSKKLLRLKMCLV